MTYLIIGASSGLGRELAEEFAKKNKNLLLISRDERDLLAIKSDLTLKYNVKVDCISLDFSSLSQINEKLLSNKNLLNKIQGVLFPVGLMFDNDNFETNSENVLKLINANYLSISYTIPKLLKYFKEKNSSIVGFGSVSGLLGRNLNSNYAASKRALESYFESLAFEKKFEEINIQFYILGYLNTNLAFGKNLLLPKGSTKKLAGIVFKNLNKKFKKKYFPFFWSFLALILKITPFSIILLLKRVFK
tara:strand:+ start:1041 stop:1781 length:741 start_codon:yes stop_codon:yes gene_type:complete